MSAFYLYDWLVEPDVNRLSNSELEHSLEPLVMEVLVYFAQHANEVISRDQLVEDVWHGRIVGDHAIYRIINQLRKMLCETKQQAYFTTIRKKGYQLVAPVRWQPTSVSDNHTLQSEQVRSDVVVDLSSTDAAVASNRLSTQRPIGDAIQSTVSQHEMRFGKQRIFVPLASVLIGLLIFGYWLMRDDIAYQRIQAFNSVRPITNLPGEEKAPSFSNAGDRIAFSHKANNQQVWHIYVQNLTNQSLTQITQGEVVDAKPVWSPNDEQLAFYRFKEGGCQILVQSLLDPHQSAELVSKCQADGDRLNDLVWSRDGESLFYTNADSSIEPFQIFQHSLKTGKVTQLTNNNSGSAKGDLKIALSPDGSKLATLRDINWGSTQLVLIDLLNHQESILVDVPGWNLSLAWSTDGQHIYFSTKKNSISIWSIEHQFSKVVANNIEPIQNPASSLVTDRLAVETGQSATDIWQVALNSSKQPAKPVVVSSAFDVHPDFANNDDRIAFSSSRSGNLQIWVRNEDGSEYQLSRFDDGRSVRQIRWSPDDKYILGYFSDGLYLVDTGNGNHRSLVSNARFPDAESPSWSHDGQSVYFTSSVNGDWQIYRVSLSHPETIQQMTQSGGYSAQESFDGNALFVLKYHKPGLWRLDLSSGEESQLITDVDAFSYDAWHVTEQELIYFSNDNEYPGIYRIPFDNRSNRLLVDQRSKVIDLPPLIKMFAIDYRHSKLAYPILFHSESSIVMLEREEGVSR